jgi:glycosyltransferase involved in cell wall biosynthesis
MFKVLESIELFLYNRSDGIISLTGSFKADLVKRGVAADHITVIENAVDAALFFPQPRDPATSNALGADPDDFLVGYIGTIGMAHGLETMVQAAALCRDTPHIRFLLMGEGSERKALEEQARSAGLKNVVFKDFVPHKEVPKYLASLSAMVVHLRPHPLFRTVIPSKIFEAMAMGVPLIHAVEGESATIVNAAGAGVCIPPGSPEALAEAILMLARNSPGRLEMSKNGVEYATRNCSRETKAVMALDFMERVARSKE